MEIGTSPVQPAPDSGDQLNGFWSAEEDYGFVNTFKYDDEKVVLYNYSLFEADRSRVVHNWLQYFRLEALTEEFAASGFRIEEVFGDTTGAALMPDSAEMTVIAKRG